MTGPLEPEQQEADPRVTQSLCLAPKSGLPLLDGVLKRINELTLESCVQLRYRRRKVLVKGTVKVDVICKASNPYSSQDSLSTEMLMEEVSGKHEWERYSP